MCARKICVHSDFFNKIPGNIIFPISLYSGFNVFDITEDFLVDIVKSHRKEYDLPLFESVSDISLINSDLSKIKSIFKDKLNNYDTKNVPNKSEEIIFNSLFIKPKYFLDDDFKFKKQLNQRWSKLFVLMYKMEFNNLVINIPSMDIPTEKIENQQKKYHQKFLKKLSDRISSLNYLLSKEEISLSINYDLFDTYKILRKRKNNENTPIIDIYSPFQSYSYFRDYYDNIIETEENIGLFIDISSYITSNYNEIKKSISHLIYEGFPIEEIKFEDEFLLRNPKIALKFFNNLKKIEFLKGVGINDISFKPDLFIYNDSKVKDEKKLLFEQKNSLFIALKQKKMMGFGNLPLKSILSSLKSLNFKTGLTDFYSLNIKNSINEFDFDCIDWRYIDIEKIGIPKIIKSDILRYLKERNDKKTGELNKISSWKKEERKYMENSHLGSLDQYSRLLSESKIYSIYEMKKMIKNYYNYLF